MHDDDDVDDDQLLNGRQRARLRSSQVKLRASVPADRIGLDCFVCVRTVFGKQLFRVSSAPTMNDPAETISMISVSLWLNGPKHDGFELSGIHFPSTGMLRQFPLPSIVNQCTNQSGCSPDYGSCSLRFWPRRIHTYIPDSGSGSGPRAGGVTRDDRYADLAANVLGLSCCMARARSHLWGPRQTGFASFARLGAAHINMCVRAAFNTRRRRSQV